MRVNLFAKSNRPLLLILLLALTLRIAYALILYAQAPNFVAFESGDYALYRIGADHFLQYHDFTNSLFLVRPPLFMLVVALLGNQPAWVVAADILFGTLTVLLGMEFARQLHPTSVDHRLIWGVGLLLAINPAGIEHSAFLGPEPLANVLLLSGMILVVRGMRQSATQPAGRGLLIGVGAGIALMASTYTRPSTYLLWIPLSLGWIVYNRRQWRAVIAFAAISVIGVAAWTYHNAQVFATPSFSTIGPYTIVYYHAASVERIATGLPIEDVYVSINQRVADYAELHFDTIDEGTRHSFLAAPPNVQNALNRVAMEIFTAHPLITLETFPIGFARMYGLFPDSITPLSVALIVVNALLLLGAAIGVGLLIRSRQGLAVWVTCLPILYYTAGTLLVKSAGLDTRERSMLDPMLAVLFVIAVMGAAAWVRRKGHPSASPETSGAG